MGGREREREGMMLFWLGRSADLCTGCRTPCEFTGLVPGRIGRRSCC